MKDLKHRLSIQIIKLLARIVKYLGFEVPPVVGVCAIIVNNKKILAIDLSYRKGHALPGGRLEREETLEEGLMREIKEETGCKVKSMKYFTNFALKKGNLVGLTICFEVKLMPGFKLESSEEGIPVWITPEEFVDTASYKDNKFFVEKYFRL